MALSRLGRNGAAIAEKIDHKLLYGTGETANTGLTGLENISGAENFSLNTNALWFRRDFDNAIAALGEATYG